MGNKFIKLSNGGLRYVNDFEILTVEKLEFTALMIGSLLRKIRILIYILSVIIIAAYGCELFSLNITIDEEIQASYTNYAIEWMRQGRWGNVSIK